MSEGGAEEAFDNLRGEVALLRRAIEGLLADPVKIPPQISRQLRSQSVELKRLAEETERLAAAPALGVTPDLFTQQIRIIGSVTAEELRAPWNSTLADLRKVGAEFARCGKAERTRDQQRRQIVWSASAGAVAAVIGWLGLSGPIARALPDQWQVAERLAAATLDLDRWHAGWRMMERADPSSWRQLNWASDLAELNALALARCAERKSSARGARTCIIELPSGQDRESLSRGASRLGSTDKSGTSARRLRLGEQQSLSRAHIWRQ